MELSQLLHHRPGALHSSCTRAGAPRVLLGSADSSRDFFSVVGGRRGEQIALEGRDRAEWLPQHGVHSREAGGGEAGGEQADSPPVLPHCCCCLTPQQPEITPEEGQQVGWELAGVLLYLVRLADACASSWAQPRWPSRGGALAKFPVERCRAAARSTRPMQEEAGRRLGDRRRRQQGRGQQQEPAAAVGADVDIKSSGGAWRLADSTCCMVNRERWCMFPSWFHVAAHADCHAAWLATGLANAAGLACDPAQTRQLKVLEPRPRLRTEGRRGWRLGELGPGGQGDVMCSGWPALARPAERAGQHPHAIKYTARALQIGPSYTTCLTAYALRWFTRGSSLALRLRGGGRASCRHRQLATLGPRSPRPHRAACHRACLCSMPHNCSSRRPRQR